MIAEKYALLRTFRGLFEGKPYLHRKSNLGDLVASQLYEDLVAINKSAKLAHRVQHHERVVNMRNVMTGKPARRRPLTAAKRAKTAAGCSRCRR